MPKVNWSRLPPRQSRGEGAADLATRFLCCKLTPDGMRSLADAIEEKLASGSATTTLEEVRAVILANPTWIDGPAMPELPFLATSARASREARA